MARNNGSYKIAREYARKYPEAPARSLARRIMTENPGLFATLETARRAVSAAFGQSVGRVKAEIPRPARTPGQGQKPPKYELPESQEETWEPFDLKSGRIGYLSDLQIPYHNLPALKAAIAAIKKRKPDCIFINGDLIDFYGISRFATNPAQRDLPGEIAMTKQFLGYLRQTFKDARIVLKLGNHEERWEHHLWQSPLFGVPEFELQAVLKTAEHGVEVVGGRRPVLAGRLPILHGHEFQMGSAVSVNPARTTFLRTSHICMIGHNHQTSEHTQTDIWRKTLTVWSTGCLCGLWPNFARVNKWNHGFAFIEVNGQEFNVENKRIQEGVVL